MKKTAIRLITVFLLTVTCLTVTVHAKNIDAKAIGTVVENAIPLEFGYIDSTEYYMGNYFSSLKGVDDSYIATAAESTNFNEFGIFHLKDKADLRAAKEILRAYLDRRKQEFESGVIYNVDEYPKFQSATVITFGSYICYTILKPSDLKNASSAVKALPMK